MLAGNIVAEPEVLKRWYFRLNTYSKEKEKIIDNYIKGLKNDSKRLKKNM
jgi:hypothetical protein